MIPKSVAAALVVALASAGACPLHGMGLPQVDIDHLLAAARISNDSIYFTREEPGALMDQGELPMPLPSPLDSIEAIQAPEELPLPEASAATETIEAIGMTEAGGEIQLPPVSLSPLMEEKELARMHESLLPGSYRPNIYDYPYSRTFRCENWHRLWQNTAVLFGGGFVALGVLELLPDDATAWNKAEIHKKPIFQRWWTNVKKGPVWDHDNPIFNYVLHPYGGAAYYMSARSQGFNVLGSFLYSAAISTCFWEYGIEAFMEIPSIQDLFVTPVVGSIVGECFYRVKRHIVENDYTLAGSYFLGRAVCFILDPVNEVADLFRGNPNLHWSRRHNPKPSDPELTVMPMLGPVNGGPEQLWGISLSYNF